MSPLRKKSEIVAYVFYGGQDAKTAENQRFSAEEERKTRVAAVRRKSRSSTTRLFSLIGKTSGNFSRPQRSSPLSKKKAGHFALIKAFSHLDEARTFVKGTRLIVWYVPVH